jgi:hypothetical protein
MEAHVKPVSQQHLALLSMHHVAVAMMLVELASNALALL